MMTAVAWMASLLCVGLCAAAQRDAPPVFACDLKAISAADRPHYRELVTLLRAAMRDRSEISNGYAFKIDGETISLPQAAEWISLERLCCPFLTLQLSVSGNQTQWLLTLTGPNGVKPLLESEFPSSARK